MRAGLFRSILGCGALTLCLHSPFAAAAEPAPPERAESTDPVELARRRFKEADQAHAHGDYARAATLFEEAFRLAPHGSVKLNAAIAWDKAGVAARAADAYEAALELGGFEQAEAEEATARLAALKKTLGYLSIRSPVGATVRVAHVEAATVPLRLHVEPGTHLMVVSRDGQTADKRVDIGAGETLEVDINLAVPVPADDVPAPSPPGAEPKPLAAASGQRDDSVDADPSQETWGWIVLGGGVVLSGVAIALGVSALDAKDDFQKSGWTDVDAHDRAASHRTWTNVAWAGAAVAGGVGTVLLLTSPTVEF